jgi:hypothetical protein
MPSFVASNVNVGDNLLGDGQRFVMRQRTLDGLAVDELHDQVVGLNVVGRRDVRMIQRRNRPGFAREALIEARLRSLDRDDAIEPRVARFVHIPHAAVADLGDDLEMSELRAGG